MSRIRTLILLLVALQAQFAFSYDRSTTNAASSDKIFVSEFEKFTLAIDNFLVWCSINENGDTYTASATFNDNTVVDLFAEPITGFIWGHWEGTDNDSGAGDTNQATTVTLTTDKSVLACCPFPNGTGC